MLNLLVLWLSALNMFHLIPTNTKFYDLFERATEILERAAERFQQFTLSGEHVDRTAAEIKGLEHEADEVTHDLLALLHRSFITPIERSDIRRLAESIDDVLDLLDDAVRHMVLYDLHDVLPELRDLARVLLESITTVKGAVAELRTIKKRNHGILQACIEIASYRIAHLPSGAGIPTEFKNPEIPTWVKLACAGAVGAVTYLILNAVASSG